MTGLPRAVIVFGASGFVGRNFVNTLAGKVERLIGVTGTQHLVPGCHEVVRISELDRIGDLPEDTVVVHFASFRYDSQRFELAQSDIIGANVDINTRVYQFCAERRIREVRAASSVAVYEASLAIMDDARAVNFNAAPNENEAFYAWSKRWLEILANLYASRFGINTILFRLSNPYGPHDSVDPGKAHVAPAFVMKALDRSPIFAIRGDPSVERDFTYVGDVTDIFRRSLMSRGRNEVFNLCTGTTTSLSELADIVMRIAGVSKTVEVGGPGAFGPAVRRSTADRLTAAFDFVPTPLAAGMEPTIEWYRHEFVY